MQCFFPLKISLNTHVHSYFYERWQNCSPWHVVLIPECCWGGRLYVQQSVQIWLLSVWIYEVLNRCDDILPWQIAKILNWRNPISSGRKKIRFWDLEIPAVIRQLKSCSFSFQDNGLIKPKSKPPKVTTWCFSMLPGSFLFCPFGFWGPLNNRCNSWEGRFFCLFCFVWNILLFGIFSYSTSGQNSLGFCNSVFLLFRTRSSGSQNLWGLLKQNVVHHHLVSMFRRFPLL